ncbi:MAG TPA: MotA/TolQ/ExbB proton channel family protein [Vicinamibacterales bacterium]|nr:MotA/TolQ/ExbB proton channel family protein [Vicinamibacterales bacterium]
MRTFGYAALALQAPGTPESGTGGVDFVHLIANATWLAKSVLLILLLFSAVSWGVILFKTLQYRRAARHTGTFLQVFRKSTKFSEVQTICASVPASPLVGIFQAGYAELNTQLRQPARAGEAESKPAAGSARPTLRSLDAVDRALLRATSVEVSRLEKRVPFLATTASITPFIGLFGTVIGIMFAFARIGAEGSTSLAVVAPGIADALIATAAGLFAAVPAVYFYNEFTNRVKEFAAQMDDFALEFLNISERNFT